MIVARDAFVYKSEAGLVIPDVAKSKTTVGKILAVGPDVRGFEPGERVLFTRLSGIVFTVIDRTHPRADKSTGEVEFIILDQTEIYSKIKDAPGTVTDQFSKLGTGPYPADDDRIID
jgi:co-chaperonin GroES (HSP10)